MIETLVADLLAAATGLLGALPSIFDTVIEVIYTVATDEFTLLGQIIVATAGFALAWAGIRFVFGFVNRLLNKSRAGR